MFLFHERLKIGRGDVVWTALEMLPADGEAVGQASIHSQDEHGFGILNSTTVVVVGDVQSLMEAAFNAPAEAVKFEPLCGVESRVFSPHNQDHLGNTTHKLRFASATNHMVIVKVRSKYISD